MHSCIVPHPRDACAIGNQLFLFDVWSMFDLGYFVVKKSGYCGYLSIETLSKGDPYQKVQALLNNVRGVLEKVQII